MIPSRQGLPNYRAQWLATLLFAVIAGLSQASEQQRYSFGLVGLGITPMYQPPCAHACRYVLAKSQLKCSTVIPGTNETKPFFETSTECFATDDAFLLSLAWCLSQRCQASTQTPDADSLETWVVTRFWEQDLAESGQTPALEFADAMEKNRQHEPSTILKPSEPLMNPAVVATEDWAIAHKTLSNVAWNEVHHTIYSVAIVLVSILLPVVLRVVQYLLSALSPRLERMVLSHLVYPPLFQYRRPVMIRLLGEAESPTRGTTMFIVLIVALNCIFSVVGYRLEMPHAWYPSFAGAATVLVSNRVGALSYANLPVVLLFGSRNNPLLWLTGWPFATFILLHRWIGFVCIAQAVLHSILWGAFYLPYLVHIFLNFPYFTIGGIATVAMCVLGGMSLRAVRKRWYEVFIDLHIVLALLTLVTCYYHVYLKYKHQRGYENWIVLSALIMGAERIIRATTIAANGLRTAHVQEVDDEYLVVDIEGVKGGGIAYLYFPSVGWRKWENHPFSIMASSVERRANKTERRLHQGEAVFQLLEEDDSGTDMELDSMSGSTDGKQKSIGQRKSMEMDETPGSNGGLDPTPSLSTTPTATLQSSAMWERESDLEMTRQRPSRASKAEIVSGLSFLIRREHGTTARLFTNHRALPVLVEGPYPSHISQARLGETATHVVCIAGGVGLAPILPVLLARAGAGAGRTVVYFGTRSAGLISTCGLDRLRREAPDVEVHARVDRRWDVEQIVLDEAARSSGSQTQATSHCEVVVVACGPPGLLMKARCAVVEANKRRSSGVVRLVEECFT